MNAINKKESVKKSEIQELLDLRGWTRSQLAEKIHVTLNTVDRWFMDGRRKRAGECAGPAAVLIRLLLDQARQEASQSVSA